MSAAEPLSHDLNFAIEQKFREAGIELRPQRDLHIRSGVLKVEGAGLRTTQRPNRSRPVGHSVRPARGKASGLDRDLTYMRRYLAYASRTWRP